jgi:hypothetical protein
MYNRGMFEIINQTTNWTSANIDVLLLTSAYAFNPDSNFVSDIVASEISTTGYVRKDLTGPTITEDDTLDAVVLDGDNVVWTALGPASGGPIVGGATIFRNTGADGTSPVITFGDFTDTQVNGGDFTVAWAATGIIVATSP